jgi:type I restriction enzyme R subunit
MRFVGLVRSLKPRPLMSRQALNSEAIREGLKDVLLNQAGLYESLRAQAAG